MSSRTYYLEGPRLCLREVRESDAGGAYLRWMNDPQVTAYLESRFTRHSREDLLDFIRSTHANPGNYFFAIVTRAGDRHIGNIKLGPVNARHNTGDIGVIIGDPAAWGKGYATEAISLLRDYAFTQLGLHKLTASCYSDNPGSARAFEKAGFQREGLRKEQFLSGEKYVDSILLGMVNPQDSP